MEKPKMVKTHLGDMITKHGRCVPDHWSGGKPEMISSTWVSSPSPTSLRSTIALVPILILFHSSQVALANEDSCLVVGCGGRCEGDAEIKSALCLASTIYNVLRLFTNGMLREDQEGRRDEGDCVIQEIIRETVWLHWHFSIFRCLWDASQLSRFWRKKANRWRSNP